MKLVIVRHGETEANVSNILQGQSDTHLNAKGQEQARKVAKRLKWMRIDSSYVSDLSRARETAEEILKYHPKTAVNYTKLLWERSYGIFEGKTVENMVKVQKDSGLTFEEFKPEAGESLYDVQKRVARFYQQILEKNLAKTVLFVSHGTAIRCLLQDIFKESFSLDSFHKFHHENCAVTILEIDGKGKHTVKALSCVKHLA